MKRIWFGAFALSLAGCGPSYGGEGIKTPDDYVEEQERLADKQAEEEKDSPYTGEVGETDIEKKAKWDAKQADLELKRATRSAQTCPESLPVEEQKKVQRGVANVTLVFANAGHVKTASIEPPYAETPVGKCILRAMGAVIVPAYEGPEETVKWDIDLAEAPKEAPKK
jgi:hypothetical protein